MTNWHLGLLSNRSLEKTLAQPLAHCGSTPKRWVGSQVGSHGGAEARSLPVPCSSVWLRMLFCCLFNPLLVLSGIYHYWTYFHFSRGLEQMEVLASCRRKEFSEFSNGGPSPNAEAFLRNPSPFQMTPSRRNKIKKSGMYK